MGITIEAYRLVIGLYKHPASVPKARGGGKDSHRRIAILISILLLMANIESNPGPGTRSNPTDSVLNDISEKLSKMNEKMDRLCNDVSNIRAWQTHVDQKMESLNHENKQLNEAVGSLVDQNERLLRDNKEMANKLVDYEARSRRNNLIFRGIKKETDKESWEQSENLVREILRDKLEMDSGKIEINRAHRLGEML